MLLSPQEMGIDEAKELVERESRGHRESEGLTARPLLPPCAPIAVQTAAHFPQHHPQGRQTATRQWMRGGKGIHAPLLQVQIGDAAREDQWCYKCRLVMLQVQIGDVTREDQWCYKCRLVMLQVQIGDVTREDQWCYKCRLVMLQVQIGDVTREDQWCYKCRLVMLQVQIGDVTGADWWCYKGRSVML